MGQGVVAVILWTCDEGHEEHGHRDEENRIQPDKSTGKTVLSFKVDQQTWTKEKSRNTDQAEEKPVVSNEFEPVPDGS